MDTNPEVAPERSKCALLTIDMQRDFVLSVGAAHIPGTTEVVSNIRRLVQAFRTAARPIVHVVRLYLPDGSNAELVRRKAVLGGKKIVAPMSVGAELVDELKPNSDYSMDAGRLLQGEPQEIAGNEWLMFKPRWGAFYKTQLEWHLQERNVSSIVLCGCNFPNCPRATLYEASERDFKIAFVADATSGVYDRGLSELRNIGVEVLTTDECLRWFAGEVALANSGLPS